MSTSGVDTGPGAGARADEYPDLALLIHGTWRPTGAAGSLAVRNPATGGRLADLPLADEGEVEDALASSGAAFERWRRVPATERARTIHGAADSLREHAEAVAVAMSLENGKSIREARGEVDFSAMLLDYFAEEATRVIGRRNELSAGRASVTYEPIGPIAAFTTWNYPLTVPARKVGAALAAGCSIVLKPDEGTPASALALGHAFDAAGLPSGVLNIVFGEPAMVSAIAIASPVTRKVSFTGSARVGAHLARLAAEHVKPVMLELGGHAPVLVFDDVDVAAVAKQAVGAKFHNAGQSCGSPTRFYVQESIHDEFVAAFVERADALILGEGVGETTDVGALGNERRRTAMSPLVADALREGAQLELGGDGDFDGWFYRPTLLSRVPETARAMNEEPFGPIALTAPFRSRDDVIAAANRLPYGLAAYLFSNSADIVTEVPARLEVGMVGVNRFGVGDHTTYFGGVKQSGYGAEGGTEAVREYQAIKLIVE